MNLLFLQICFVSLTTDMYCCLVWLYGPQVVDLNICHMETTMIWIPEKWVPAPVGTCIPVVPQVTTGYRFSHGNVKGCSARKNCLNPHWFAGPCPSRNPFAVSPLKPGDFPVSNPMNGDKP